MELALLVAALLLATVAIYLTGPLLAGPRTIDGASGSARDAEALLERKAMVYQSIRDAELDLATGKLSSSDHEEMVKELKREAASIIRALDDVGQPDATRAPAPAPKGGPRRASKKANAKKLHRHA